MSYDILNTFSISDFDAHFDIWNNLKQNKLENEFQTKKARV